MGGRLVTGGRKVCFCRLLCGFRGRYYSEEVDEQHRVSEESAGSGDEWEEADGAADGAVEDAGVCRGGGEDGAKCRAGDSWSGDDEEEARDLGESAARGRGSSGGGESVGGRDGGDGEICGGRGDGATRLCRSRAVLDLESSTFVSTTGGGGFGRCFIEVGARECGL